MPTYTYQGRTIRPGRGWTDDAGTQYPGNWLSLDIESLGVTVTPDAPRFDSKWYWPDGSEKAIDDVPAVDENGDPVLDENGDQIITRGLKYNEIQRVRAVVEAKLRETDYLIIRASEDQIRGRANPRIPDNAALDARDAWRTASNNIEAAIMACATHADLMAMYATPVDADGNPTGNAPINDWPED